MVRVLVMVACTVQERDAALSRQRELVSEVSDLKSRLDTMKTTCRQLRLKASSPDLRDKVEEDEDEESRVLKEKIAKMLSDDFVTVQPRQQSILKHLRMLVNSVRNHNMVCVFVSACNILSIYYPLSTLDGE